MPESDDFAKAAQQRGHGLARDLLAFIWQSKKWWLVPVILVLLLVGVLVVLGGSAIAPFIYTLF